MRAMSTATCITCTFCFTVCSCDCCVLDEGVGGCLREEGDGGEGWDKTARETYSSIQLIKIPLSKKPVKFR